MDQEAQVPQELSQEVQVHQEKNKCLEM